MRLNYFIYLTKLVVVVEYSKLNNMEGELMSDKKTPEITDELLIEAIDKLLEEPREERTSIEYGNLSDYLKKALKEVRDYPDKHNGKLPTAEDIAEVMGVKVPVAISYLHTLLNGRFLDVEIERRRIKGERRIARIYKFKCREDT